MADGRLAGRVALVTGASRGIGAAVALRLAQEGAHLVLAARTVGGLEELDDKVRAAGSQALLVPMDLTKPEQIDQLGPALFERFKRLDIVVANAGLLGVMTPVAHLDPRVWDETMAVNVTANYRLIRTLDPLLRASDAGRAIFVTSGAARISRAYWSVYAASKAALESLVRIYAAETEKTRLRVNLLNPGPVRTGMRAAAFPGEDPMTLPPPEALADLFLELALPSCTRHGETLDARSWIVETGRWAPAA